MSDTSNKQSAETAETLFGDVIFSYTREQAIEDGVLIDAGSIAREAGFNLPVAFTSAAWADCVAWTEDDSRQQVYQDQSGRLHDVLFMAHYAIRTRKEPGSWMLFRLHRIPRDGKSTEAGPVTLKLMVGPGDTGEAVATVMLPHED